MVITKPIIQARLNPILRYACWLHYSAPDDTPDDHITRNQFCEKKLPGRNFTFWEWFYKIAELTAGHLSAKGSTEKKKIAPLWEEGYGILNLVSRI